MSEKTPFNMFPAEFADLELKFSNGGKRKALFRTQFLTFTLVSSISESSNKIAEYGKRLKAMMNSEREHTVDVKP